MVLLFTTSFALVLWIVLWALGLKAFDGGLIALLLILLAATAQFASAYLPGNRREDQ
jgi:hypothetical protein